MEGGRSADGNARAIARQLCHQRQTLPFRRSIGEGGEEADEQAIGKLGLDGSGDLSSRVGGVRFDTMPGSDLPQLAGAAIDRWGLLGSEKIPLHWPRLIGLALLAAGAALSLKK